MSPKSQVSGLATTLSITNPTEVDRAVLAAMTIILGMFTTTSTTTTTTSPTDEQKARITSLHTKISAKAEHILSIKSELKTLKQAAETWYNTILQFRSQRMDGNNPWREEARQLIQEKTGETNNARIAVMTADYLLFLKRKWKATWEKMARIEKTLLTRSKLGKKEFQTLLSDCDAVSMRRFDADMQTYRDLASSLSAEFTKINSASSEE